MSDTETSPASPVAAAFKEKIESAKRKQPPLPKLEAKAEVPAKNPKDKPVQNPFKGQLGRYFDERVKKASLADAPAPQKPAPKAPEKDEAEVEPEEASKPAESKSRKNLKLRAQVPDAILGKLSDEEADQWWSSLQSRETNIDRTLSEQARRLRELEERVQAEPEPESEPTADENAIFEGLRREYGDQLADGVRTLITSQSKKYEKEIAGLKKEAVDRDSYEMARLAGEAREELGKRFPGLLDDSIYYDVIEEMNHAGRSKRYQEMGKVDRKRAMFALMEGVSRAQGLEEAQSESAGRPAREPQEEPEPSEVTRTRTRRSKPRTYKEQVTRAVEHLMRHGRDVPGARRAAGG